jgi:hypothetical protein
MWHKNPERFADALEKIFGAGAQLLLKAIARELYSSIGLKYEEAKKFRFAHFIHRAGTLRLHVGGGGVRLKGREKAQGNVKEKRGVSEASEVMKRAITVRDVVKGKANLTEVRFRIVVAMLQTDKYLVKRVKAYIKNLNE